VWDLNPLDCASLAWRTNYLTPYPSFQEKFFNFLKKDKKSRGETSFFPVSQSFPKFDKRGAVGDNIQK
jgi:hypothetical protein